MSAKRDYFTLCERVDGVWSPQFGDYCFRVVADERDDMVDGGVRRRDLAIVASLDDQASIDARVAALNMSGI